MSLPFAAILAVLFTGVAVQAVPRPPPPAPQLPLYRRARACESRDTCTYRYFTTLRNWEGAERQVTSVHATVDVWCSSVGTYGGQTATRYCMDMSGVTVDGDLFRDDSNDEVLDDTEEDIPELPDPQETILQDPPISPEDILMSNWFCFIQTEDGKVVTVHHPRLEVTEVVNFKKGIAAAFQSNFNGTTVEEEQDTMSQHRSTYSYTQGPSGTTTAYRTVDTSNVIAYAGGTPRGDIELDKEESVRYESGTLTYSSGTTQVSFTAQDTCFRGPSGPTGPGEPGLLAVVPDSRYEDGQEAGVVGPRKRRGVSGPQEPVGPRPDDSQQTYDDTIELSEFSAEGSYRLYRVCCKADLPVRPEWARSRREVGEDEKDAVFDNLGAKIDRKLIDQHQMHLLRQRLTSIGQTLEALHEDTDNLKLADLLHRLISLEAEYQPLPGHEAAVNDVISYLNKLKGSNDDRDRKMRMLLYSFLSPEGSLSAQQALFNALTVAEQEERSTLVSYIAFAANPHLRFVKQLETLISAETTSTDPLLLAYGSLASSSSAAVEEHILRYLLQRLSAVDELTKPFLRQDGKEGIRNDTWALIHLIHSLGNTGSQGSVAALLNYLQHPDLDVQLAAISALRMHTLDPAVQNGLVGLLTSARLEEQVQEVTQAMIDGLEHTRMKNNWQKESDGSNEMLLALLVTRVMQSNNSRLHELVLQYLHDLDTTEARQLAKVLTEHISKNPSPVEDVHFVDDVDGLGNGTAGKTRARRGADWDAQNSVYNLIASYSSRNQDVNNYKHKAYIWGKKFGLKKLYMQVAAGGFAGIRPNLSGYKLFAKAVAQGHAFGHTATPLQAEFLRRRTGSSIYQKIYAKVVGKVLINEAGYYVGPVCTSLTKNLYSTQIKIFKLKFSVFIYVGTLDFYVGMYARLKLDLQLKFCETTIKACASLIPQATIRAEGGASATILFVVRGGIEVAAEFTYKMEPEVCIHFCKQYPGPRLKLKKCITVYHSWPKNFAEIYAYYQRRKVSLFFKWGPKKRWNALSAKWNLGSTSKKKLWSSCDPSINCYNGRIGLPGFPGLD